MISSWLGAKGRTQTSAVFLRKQGLLQESDRTAGLLVSMASAFEQTIKQFGLACFTGPRSVASMVANLPPLAASEAISGGSGCIQPPNQGKACNKKHYQRLLRLKYGERNPDSKHLESLLALSYHQALAVLPESCEGMVTAALFEGDFSSGSLSGPSSTTKCSTSGQCGTSPSRRLTHSVTLSLSHSLSVSL